MADDQPIEPPPLEPNVTIEQRFPELAEIQREVELRIRDNQRFLERFLNDDFADEEEDPEEEDGEFEEL